MNIPIQHARIRRTKKLEKYFLFLVMMAGYLSTSLNAQPFPTGTIASDFTLKDRRTGEDVSLSDFEGQVIVLDFFAYWCAPCAFSSPDIEQNIQRFYKDQDGNANGVPVQVLSVNIESGNPELTDDFIQQTDLDLVIDDTEAIAWNLFNQTNGIPLFAIINGVDNSPSHEQWEVLHNAPSYPGAEFLRTIIDSVEAALPPPDPIEVAVDLGEDWRWIDWFGSFQAEQLPWIFHEEHGWMFMGDGNLNTGQFILDITLGWIWTDRIRFPNIFSFDRNSWLLYDIGTTEPRLFHEHQSNQTLEFINASVFDPFFNGFNLGNVTIPLEEIISGGPPRDGIPSLSDPNFLFINQVDYMVNSDILIAVTSGGETRGYPFRILNWHEVVNDQIDDDAFVVTYCPLCGTAIVFEAEVNGYVRNFGVSGMLFQNNVLMYDRGTESLWSQFMLQSVSGTMQKIRLKWKLSEQITWEDFKTKYPGGKLLSTNTGFSRRYDLDPYAAYFESDGPLFRTNNPVRDDLPEKEWVWGITVDGVAKAYPLDRLPNNQPIRDSVNGVELELVLNAQARSVVVTVVSTGEPLDNGVGSFWFSWQDFFHETLVFL
ncbi:MAG: DUF3179 domain-containing (seleno)protein [Verrucomicrobia bacterium]|nr:DUF3179 domain-containing (seleno)protein [Verrucomicrobiota bacterium]